LGFTEDGSGHRVSGSAWDEADAAKAEAAATRLIPGGG